MGKRGKVKKGGAPSGMGGVKGLSKTAKKALQGMSKQERSVVVSSMKSRAHAGWSQAFLQNKVNKAQAKADAAQRGSKPPQLQTAYRYFTKRDQRILIIGDGNFSFAHSLVQILNGDGSLVTATCYDSGTVLNQKYSDAKKFVKELNNCGCTIHTSIDGTKLGAHKELDPPYDLVIFNFPHVGLGIKDKEKNILANQQLVEGYLRSAKDMIHDTGAITVSVKKGEPYDSWKVARLGIAIPGLRLKTAMEFDPSSFAGFAHRRTIGELKSGDATDEAPDDNEIISKGAKTYVFTNDKGEAGENEGMKKRKKMKAKQDKRPPKE